MREDRLTPADVAGGSFAATNLGALGVEKYPAIINPPQAAILAVGAIQEEVFVAASDTTLCDTTAGDAVTLRMVMRMTLSADHRVVDGAVPARFARDLPEGLETLPLLLL